MTTIKLMSASAAAVSLLMVAINQREPAVEMADDGGESYVAKTGELFLDHWVRAAGLVMLLAALTEETAPSPAVKVVATETITPPVADPRVAVAIAPKPQEKHVELDTCQRHHMHKVYIRGGRSWRCRR